jgi:uncharacterized protein YegL
MKNKEQSKIIMLLDRSGSMQSIKKETIKGFNSFLKKQQKSNSKIEISLYQFDDSYDVVYESVDVMKALKLNKKLFIPRGLTALLDAIGETISRNSPELQNKEANSTQTIFVIITDGLENASSEYTLKAVTELIKQMEEEYGWQFVYLGANQDAIKVASRFGIDEKRAIRYAADIVGTRDIFNSVSERVSESIEYSSSLSFMKKDRDKQKRD